MWDYRVAMLVSEGLTELLVNLAAGGEDTDASRAAEDRADEIIALFVNNLEQAGRVMLGLTSFIVFSWGEHADKIDPHRAASIVASPPEGEPVPFFVDFLHAMIDAAEAGEKVRERAIRLLGKITESEEHTGLCLWVLATYLVTVAPEDPEGKRATIDTFVASMRRQEFFFDVELN